MKSRMIATEENLDGDERGLGGWTRINRRRFQQGSSQQQKKRIWKKDGN